MVGYFKEFTHPKPRKEWGSQQIRKNRECDGFDSSTVVFSIICKSFLSLKLLLNRCIRCIIFGFVQQRHKKSISILFTLCLRIHSTTSLYCKGYEVETLVSQIVRGICSEHLHVLIKILK